MQKQSGKFRLILNLKSLNIHIRYKHFSMDSILSVQNILPLQCFMALMDLRDAYLHIPIRERSKMSALRFFTKVLEEALAPLWLQAVQIISYLDDFLLFASSQGQLERDVQTSVLSGKSGLVGQQGEIVSNSRTGKDLFGLRYGFSLSKALPSKRKIQKLLNAAKYFQWNTPHSLRCLMAVLGLMTVSIPTVQWAWFHQCPQQAFLFSGPWTELYSSSPSSSQAIPVVLVEEADSLVSGNFLADSQPSSLPLMPVFGVGERIFKNSARGGDVLGSQQDLSTQES